MQANGIWAAYIRVSTEEQAEYSPDAQLVEIRRYAARNGLVVPDSFLFIDEGISGKKTEKREAFNQMIGLAKQKPKPFDGILLWKFSRFARNREDSVVYKSMLRKQLGIEVVSVSEPIGDDKMSILIEALIEAMDEYYSINLAEEVKRGMTEKARRGGLQSTPSFGYAVRDNILIPVQDEADVVRMIFARFIAGEGLYPIARLLNDMGVKTHRGNRFENRTIEYILRNPVYIGKLRWNPTGRSRRDFTNENIILSDAKHEALISMEIWNAAQERMAAVKAQWRYKARPTSEHKHWMSGLIRCASCGNTILFSKNGYCQCNAYAKGACKHSQHIRCDLLEGMLLAVLRNDALDGVHISYTAAPKGLETVDEAAALNESLSSIDKKLERLRAAYLSGVESLNSYAEAKAVLEAQQLSIKGRITATEGKRDASTLIAVAKQQIASCLALLENPEATKEEKHREAGNIMGRTTFSKATNAISITYRVMS